ncbi:hypothetical protein MMC09_006446 [Bachmanniomyces sp. S44760]|nr:hypothetical protein [Bachmanniomyces sp. S44760]
MEPFLIASSLLSPSRPRAGPTRSLTHGSSAEAPLRSAGSGSGSFVRGGSAFLEGFRERHTAHLLGSVRANPVIVAGTYKFPTITTHSTGGMLDGGWMTREMSPSGFEWLILSFADIHSPSDSPVFS